MANTAIGIDFGHSHIKLVELRRRGRQVHLRRASLLPIPAGTLRSGVVVDEKKVAASISELLPGLRVERAAVVVGITGPAASVRAFGLETVPDEDVGLAVRQEFAALLRLEPADMEGYYFDYHVLPSSSMTHHEVVAVSIEKSAIDGYLRPLREANLPAHVLDLSAFALPRVAPLAGQACYIDIGAEYTQVFVTLDGEYSVFRLMPVGMNHLASATAIAYDVSPAQAVALLGQTHVNDLVSQAPGDRTHLQRILQEIAGGVMQTLEFLRVKQRASSITDLLASALLCGGGALQPGIPQMLSEELGVHVDVMHPLSALAGAQDLPNSTIAVETLFAGAVGLALRGVEEL